MIYPKIVPTHSMTFPKHHADGWQLRCKCGWVSEVVPAGYLKDAHHSYTEHADDSEMIEPLPSGVPFSVTGWGRQDGTLGIRRFEHCYILDQDRTSLRVVDGRTGWCGRLTLPITVTPVNF